MSEMIAFNHSVTDEPIALVRLASDEGAVLHLVRLQHEPTAPGGSSLIAMLRRSTRQPQPG